MANSYFRFKQFTIQQDTCAMKVTTDGCLFGAIVAKEISAGGACKILDIGTGTGLLALMMAQENEEAIVDAIEIDEMAARQAKENVAALPWDHRINVLQADILSYQPSFLYDVVVSNPPFYEQQLSSPNKGRELAHHSSELTLQQLFQQTEKLLVAGGKFFVLLPFYRVQEAISLAEKMGLSVQKQWLVKQTPKHSFFRTIFCFRMEKTEIPNHFEITIRDEKGNYTDAFAKLLQPFYLHL